MPALAADIEAATRPNGVTLDVQANGAVQAAHPNARDGLDQPIRAFWDSPADAAVMCAERLALLEITRRRFRVEVDGVHDIMIGGATTPAVTLVDSVLATSGPFLVTKPAFDFMAERTIVEVWG